jgi:hypothetical protein
VRRISSRAARDKAAGALRSTADRLARVEPEQDDEFERVPRRDRSRPATVDYMALDRREHDALDASGPPSTNHGQLDASHQAALARHYENVDPATCHWYHEAELRDGRRIAGGWDLVNGERAYLGEIDLEGSRVLEMGPATGHLTFWMERHGADVVAFEAGTDPGIDLISYGLTDLEDARQRATGFIERVHRSWWWLRSHWDASAVVARGSIYELPPDLGTFDVATFGSILLHLRDPYAALASAAAVTRRSIVVTDVVPSEFAQPSRPLVRFNPVPGDKTSWWLLAPGAVSRMLATLGFERQRLLRHVQYHRANHDPEAPALPVDLYTVVGSRE